jgi:L-amino acid N-acyltransferase YncA
MAGPEDAVAIADIDLPYVRDAVVSFETVPPGVQEKRSRLTATLAELPWLVVTDGGRVKGYSSASAHRATYTGGVLTRRYAWTAQSTIADMAAASTRR